MIDPLSMVIFLLYVDGRGFLTWFNLPRPNYAPLLDSDGFL